MVEVDIAYVCSVAREAGMRALDGLTEISPEFKADDSYVTHIDRETEKYIQHKLAERYPDWGYQGEEFGRVRGEAGDPSGPLWAVDPIDGTTNMVFGLPIWGVSIGLIAEGQAVAGAFYMPRTAELFWGVRGQGSYCNGVRMQVKDREVLHVEDTVGFTSSACKTLNVEEITGRIRCFGSVAAEVAYAAKGAFCSHVGVREGTNDLTAVFCIAREAGCVIQYLTGEEIDMRDMAREGRTRAPYVVAPPHLAALLQSQLKSKGE